MKFFKDIFSNPDGTYSTKRSAGWLCLFCAIIVGFVALFKTDLNEVIVMTVFGGFLSAYLGSFGISSFDSNTYWKNNKSSGGSVNMETPLV